MDLAVDLHVHTTASDGAYAPEKVVRLAESRRLKGLAITDHDTVAGIEPALEAVRRIEFIPGIELTTESGGEEIHLLGYYIDYQKPELLDFLSRFQKARKIEWKKCSSGWESSVIQLAGRRN